jgi:hypothetical protein
MRQRVLAALMAVAGAAGAMTMAATVPAAASAAAKPASSRVAAAPGGWGQAALLPGAGKLGQGGADGLAVSCPSTGNCTAGGSYFQSGGNSQIFVISERNGRWGNAEELPGLGALNTKGDGELAGVSCASPGDCVAAGSYLGSAGQAGYVAVQKGGRWGQAENIPGLSALSTGEATVGSVSCGSPGNCVVGGRYLDGSDQFQAFVATMSNGHWATATEVPGTAALNAGGSAQVTDITCRKAGDCSAAGSYRPSTTTTSGFVVTETNGHWGNAIQIPGLASLNAGGSAAPVTMSCASPGNCVTGGSYRDAASHTQAFLAAQKNGHWNKAAQARGTGALNAGGSAQVTAMSCPSAGNCAAAGVYEATTDHFGLFVITERNGSWGQAAVLPGILSHNKGSSTQVYSLACTSVGNCSAGGYYENAAFREFAFVITESGGRWGSVIEVPGLASLSPGGDSGVTQLSCPAAGHCVGVGYGSSAAHMDEAFYLRRT